MHDSDLEEEHTFENNLQYTSFFFSENDILSSIKDRKIQKYGTERKSHVKIPVDVQRRLDKTERNNFKETKDFFGAR